MSIVNSFRQESALKLNDVIEDFKYVYKGQSIKAGDFVNYINGVADAQDYGKSVDTQIYNGSNAGVYMSATQLDDTHVFIAHKLDINESYFYCTVCHVNGATIIPGTPTVISNNSGSGNGISAVALNDEQVFISHSSDEDDRYLHGIVCRVEGLTVILGTDTALVKTTQAGDYSSTVLLSTGKVFIAHSSGTSYTLYSLVCTINDLTITKDFSSALNTATDSGAWRVSATKINDDNDTIFVAHGYGANDYLYGIVCTVSGTAITKGTDTALSTTSKAGNSLAITKIENNKVFISHTCSTTYYLYGIVCTISGTTITKGTDTLIASVESRYDTDCVALPNGTVLVLYGDSSYYLYGVICNINNLVITFNASTQLNNTSYTGFHISAVLMFNHMIFIAHCRSSTRYLWGQIFNIDYDNNIPTNHIVVTEYETQVTPAIEPPFDAVAVSSGKGSPEYTEQEVVKSNNLFPGIPYWEANDTYTQFTLNGYTIEASSVDSTNYANLAVDDTINTKWVSTTGLEHWLKMTCPKPQHIKKMDIVLNIDVNNYNNLVIQGSNDNNYWNNLYTISQNELTTSGETTLKNITLNNPDYYKYYRISGTFTQEGVFSISDWKASEYIAKELLPSAEHNEQVRIARLPIEVTKTGNMFPTSWTQVSTTEYTADGFRLTSSTASSSTGVVIDGAEYALDGDISTEHDLTGIEAWVKVELGNATKITKMKTLVSGLQEDYGGYGKIQGSNNDVDWQDLYTISTSQTTLTEIQLSNTDFYKYYRILIHREMNYGNAAHLYEWQTSEYTTKEVIQ